jgi:UDP-3-O-[3-hydroxymyristoyl] glucosamine N-acyltransferase
MGHFTLGELADRLAGVIENGDATLKIFGVRPIAEARAGDITVVVKRSDVRALERTPAAAAVAPARVGSVARPTIRVHDPRLALARLLELFYARPREITGIDPRAVITPGARIGRDVNIAAGAYVAREVEIGDRVDIYPGVYLGDGVRIGDDSVLFANVAVYAGTVIGKRARIHSGAVIGSDGFGYTTGPSGELYKVPQVGGVEIGDDVEIGANTTVDRATMTHTRVGSGTKIDNLVQIAHNVEIGAHVCIVAQSGIAGSVRIGAGAVLGAGAGLADHLTMGEGARLGARAGAHRDIPSRTTFIGTPAIPGPVFVRAYSLIPHLPEYRRRLKELEARCARLEAELRARGKEDRA